MEKTGEILCEIFIYTRCDGMEKFEGIDFEVVSLSNRICAKYWDSLSGSNALHLLMH